MAFLECFPDLTHLSIMDVGHLTASCISWVMEKFSSKLHQFELRVSERFSSCPPFGAFTGIQTCSNLQHLSLYWTGFVSDVLMGALAAGCHKLETLNIYSSDKLTNGGLAALAMLPNLTKLNISGWYDLSAGVTAIALQGQLIEFVSSYVPLSVACLKTIVRHCRYLKRLEVSDNYHRLTEMDVIEIVRLYGIWGMEPHLVFYCDGAIWRAWNVWAVIEEISEIHHRHFEILRGN